MSDKNIFRIGKGLVGLWIIITVVFSFFVMMGFFVSIPQASMDPKHEIFVAQERIDKEFPNSVHPIPFVILGENGEDVLTKDVLAELYEKSQSLRVSELGKEYLNDFALPFLGNTGTLGLFSLADITESFLNKQGSSLKEATDGEVKNAISILLEDPQYGSFLQAQLSSEAEFKNGEWLSPTLAFFVSANNEKLGGGVFRRTVGGDEVMLEKEEFNRKIEASLQGENYKLLGIGIDLNIESEEEGYSPSILILISTLLFTLAIFTGVLFSSFRLFLLTMFGLLSVFIWVRGFPLATFGLVKPSLTTDVILPIAFMSFGVDFLIHVVHQYKEKLKTSSQGFEKSFIESFRKVNLALFLAMFTTAIAFAANYVSSVEAVKAFAITGFFASFASYFIMGMIIPFLFALWEKDKTSSKSYQLKTKNYFNMGALMNSVIKNKSFVVILLFIATVFFGSNVFLVEKSLDPIDFINSESNFVVSLDQRDIHYGDTRGEEASIYIKGNFTDAKVQRALEDILVLLNNNSYLAHTKEGQLVLPYGLPEVNKIDEETYSERIIFEVIGTREQKTVKEAFASLESDLKVFDGIASYEIVGSPFTRDASLEAVTDSLISTIITALLIIFLVLLIVFRSFFYAIITLIPMLLVVVWIYGLMGIFNLSLNFITATVAAVSLGVGIDYSVHLVQRFRQEYKKEISFEETLMRVGKTTGFALFVSALSSTIGFMFLAQAQMPLFATYGLLATAMIIFSFFATFFVLPLLLALKKK
ncbi:hypothetical protein A2442_01550 [Candidatus Campbellbacteria bacterium RIFOXYC2_FULL_35_25]|uniref:SSD domain-containing protein n=1 Tax=Candidatus Campbellbacteria bacterium RIFOXYC2_FULL_35_25 TaxID=1797582 RepID=A0A1F5EHD1_9BACT|nr:MAG: hypothetical protein A2442_01550 [Candidatus Campbellbacteria bacterium RIFOXYC2_FULL_35_25]